MQHFSFFSFLPFFSFFLFSRASLLRGIREKTKRNKKILAYLVVGENFAEKSVLLSFFLIFAIETQQELGHQMKVNSDQDRRHIARCPAIYPAIQLQGGPNVVYSLSDNIFSRNFQKFHIFCEFFKYF